MDSQSNLEEKKPMSQKEIRFNNFLNEHRIKTGKSTHTGVAKHTGKYVIEGNDLKKFYALYSEVMKEETDIHLIEQHADISPFVIDIDLRLKPEDYKRKYDYNFIRKVSVSYINQILHYFDLENNKQLVQCFVFERPAPYYAKNMVKDGIHLMFPFIVTEPAIQEIIRENVIKEIKTDYEKLGYENNVFNAIDKAVINQVGWYMYGSTKPGVDRYHLNYIFDYEGEKMSTTTYDETYLPQLLSIRDKEETTQLKTQFLEEVSNYNLKNQKTAFKRKKKETALLSDEDIEDIYELVSMFSVERADDYHNWLNVGMALHSIDPHSDTLCGIWDDFSQKSEKYTPTCCENEWINFKYREDGLNMGSIYHWAKTDNHEKYSEFRNNQIRSYIDKSMTGTNVDVAKVLHKMYKYQWVCSNIKSNSWFRFKKHHWVEDETGIELRNKISNELVQEYCKLISFFNEKITLLEEQVESETDKKKKFEIEVMIKSMDNKIDKLTNITKNLKTTSFIDNIMKECKGLFYDKDFAKKLDENPDLFSFSNGVLDLKTGSFREGRPDDFLSIKCGVPYIPYSKDLPYLDDINDFLEKVQPQANPRKYMMSMMSSLLEGHNADESFHLWTGTGGNGKSKLNELLVLALGDYAVKFPITLFTGKRGASNSVSPEVVESKGKRYAYLEEPGEGEKLNIGLMKEYSGGDLIKGRNLFSGFIQFKPQFKLILFCNDPPSVPPDDMGTWRRLKVLEFLSKFVDNPRAENEYLKDRYLSSKIPLWAESFMAMLVHHYFESYKKDGGLFIPKEVEAYTKEFQKEMDLYIDFIDSNLIRTEKASDKVSLSLVHENFKIWYQENFASNKFPAKRDIRKYVEKKFGKKACNNQYLIGFIRKNNDEEEEEED